MRRWLVLLPCLGLTGCLIVPHTVEPEAVESREVVLPSEEILVTLGPRQFLDSMKKDLSRADPDLDIIDGVRFRDTAFPEGGWTLAQLLTPETRARLRRELEADYLLLFGRLETESGTDEGTKGVAVGALPVFLLAAVQLDETSDLTGLVIDLASGDIASQVDVTASTNDYVAIAWLVAVGTVGDTIGSARKGMARALAKAIRSHTDKARPRVALMAAESGTLWKPVVAKGWKRTDEGTGSEQVYLVFDECGLEEASISLQQAFDRAMEFYREKDWEAAYDCFGFVQKAGEDDLPLVHEARRRMQFMVGAGLAKESESPPSTHGDEWEPKP